jgi:hypothetical protein
MFAGASPMRGSAWGASVVHLRTAIGARLQGTTLVHTRQSGERQVIDFIGVAGARWQSLLALRAKSNVSTCSGLSDAHSPPPRSIRQWYTGPYRLGLDPDPLKVKPDRKYLIEFNKEETFKLLLRPLGEPRLCEQEKNAAEKLDRREATAAPKPVQLRPLSAMPQSDPKLQRLLTQ